MHGFEFWIFATWVTGIMVIAGWPSDQYSWLTSLGSMLCGCVIAIFLAVWLGTKIITIIMALVIVCLIVNGYLYIRDWTKG